jgi:uncharacterized membrane protein
MPLPSLLLLLAAAVLHAFANSLIKLGRDKLAFTWWMLGASSVLGLPIWLLVGNVEPAGWLFVVISGVLEAVYFASLGTAYSHGDLSQVYPIARGSAPLFVVVWAALFLGERPSAHGLLGILSIVAGLYLINLPSLADWKRPLLGFKTPAARWALVTGFLISVYSAVDKVGVRYFDPLIYLYLILFVGWLVLTPQWLRADRREALIAEFDRRASIAASAFFGIAAYAFVLTALRLSPVSYVSPVREVSVVIGAWIGVRFMAERGGRVRIVASLLVALGIILIAAGG